MKTTKKILFNILGGANVATIAAMLLTGYSGCLNPAEHPYLCVTGLSFPVFLCINIAFIFVWTFIKWRYVVIPAVGMLLSLDLICDYSPLSSSSLHPEESMKVLSFNVLAFSPETQEDEGYRLIDYLTESGADIIAVQEFTNRKSRFPKEWERLEDTYPYIEEHNNNDKTNVAVLSKYPIKRVENLNIESVGNVAAAFYLDVKDKEFIVINAHLETIGFSMEDKEKIGLLMRGKTEKDSLRQESSFFIHKLANAGSIRSHQADVIAEFIERHKGSTILFCGDINDHPLSYTHRKIAENLTDCYRETGFMPGFTHSGRTFMVRIDNIMSSSDLVPYECQVDKSIKLSDHYPIYCYFKQK